MLGLFSPYTRVLPTPNTPRHTPVPVQRFDLAAIEHKQLTKAITNMDKRTRAGIDLSLSFRERTIFLSFYVLSLPTYHHSVLLPSPLLLKCYCSMIRRMLCPRPWIQSNPNTSP